MNNELILPQLRYLKALKPVTRLCWQLFSDPTSGVRRDYRELTSGPFQERIALTHSPPPCGASLIDRPAGGKIRGKTSVVLGC